MTLVDRIEKIEEYLWTRADDDVCNNISHVLNRLGIKRPPMKLGEYIAKELKRGRKKFDIGVDDDMMTNDDSPNRIKFEVK